MPFGIARAAAGVADKHAKKIAWSIGLALLTAPVSYAAKKTLEAWGVLDPFSVWLGHALKTHVSPSVAGWTIALAVLTASYGFALWLIWRGHSPAKGLPTSIQTASEPADEPIPDMPIRDLFFHIDAKVLDGPDLTPTSWEVVGQEILDQLSLGKLTGWARTLYRDSNTIGPIQKMVPGFWQNVSWTYAFFSRGSRHIPDVANRPGTTGPEYTDLHVSSSEALRIWPRLVEAHPLAVAEDTGRKNADVRRDADLREGLCWIVFGRWDLTPATDGGGFLDQLSVANQQVRQAASERNVRVWGKDFMSGLYKPINAGFWAQHEADMTRLMYPASEVESQTIALSATASIEQYSDLKISRAEFEKEWPTNGNTYPDPL